MSNNVTYLPMALCAQHNAEVHQHLAAAGLGAPALDARDDAAAETLLAGESINDYLQRTNLMDPDRLAEALAGDVEDDEEACDPVERVALTLAHDLGMTVLHNDSSMLEMLRLRGAPVCPVCEMVRHAASLIPNAVAECVLHFESEHGHNQ